jgi:proteasome assembly chaperone (PAC2) family protein
MEIRYSSEPDLTNPVMIASWPGIGNIGLIAVDSLRRSVDAEKFAYIEPWEFFYPNKAVIRDGQLMDIMFPSSAFYFKKTGRNDLIFFIGEEQPAEGGRVYAEGNKAYAMANLVLNVAQRFGCHRIYTSGAAVAPIHHTMRSGVWAVPNSPDLLDELKKYGNVMLMSDVEGREGRGNITGLNGLLLGVAHRRGIEAVCMMGEIPMYLQGFPFLYPKASKAVIEVLAGALNITTDMDSISQLSVQSEQELSNLYEKLPAEIKDQLDRLKQVNASASEGTGVITEEDKKKILDDIDKFFKRGGEQH